MQWAAWKDLPLSIWFESSGACSLRRQAIYFENGFPQAAADAQLCRFQASGSTTRSSRSRLTSTVQSSPVSRVALAPRTAKICKLNWACSQSRFCFDSSGQLASLATFSGHRRFS